MNKYKVLEEKQNGKVELNFYIFYQNVLGHLTRDHLRAQHISNEKVTAMIISNFIGDP